jgi:NAD(P)-dependent dehydrogenase (short-subunit alcohol dehydrogenase family)
MTQRVAIVTGASSGIGLGITRSLLDRGYAVVGASRTARHRGTLVSSKNLSVVDGDVGEASTARRIVDEAGSRFGRVDVLVNNAGSLLAKPFTEYSSEDYARLLSTNFAGFFHMTQAALRIMVRQKSGHVVNIGTSLVATPIAGVPCALPVLIKGGIEAATRALAIEYAPQGIRVNTVSAGIIDTPMHQKESHASLAGLSPAGRIGTVQEMTDAVNYLESAPFVSGEILHVDGGAHAGKWS